MKRGCIKMNSNFQALLNATKNRPYFKTPEKFSPIEKDEWKGAKGE
jgi:hypothetical protein